MSIAERLDQVIASAWPARHVENVDGWSCRLTDGVTRRANSVRVVGAPADLESAVNLVEAFYQRAQRPPVFLVSDRSAPSEVATALLARGYVSTATTSVLKSTVPAGETPSRHLHVEVESEPTDRWFDAYMAAEVGGRSEGDVAALRDVLLRPSHPTSFVSVAGHDGAIASVGQVVVVDGWANIQCLATMPGLRRQGAGRAVVDALMAQGVLLGAEGFVAAVLADNAASLGLFEKLGFEHSHSYSYFVVADR